jgi:hypothetical protein
MSLDFREYVPNKIITFIKNVQESTHAIYNIHTHVHIHTHIQLYILWLNCLNRCKVTIVQNIQKNTREVSGFHCGGYED